MVQVNALEIVLAGPTMMRESFTGFESRGLLSRPRDRTRVRRVSSLGRRKNADAPVSGQGRSSRSYAETMTKIYAVEYRYVTDKDEEMAAVRPSHRAFNGRLADEGRLLAAGPYVGTHDALIVVRAEDEAGALALLEDDPFQQAGYIAERIPREWNPVIGVLA